MNPKEKYIHGFSDDEQARLTRMQEILNRSQLAALDLSNVRRVLDVGSGLGQMTRAIAEPIVDRNCSRPLSTT